MIWYIKRCHLKRWHLSLVSNAYFSVFSHFWLATPQLVLQADWQEVWHSPQPPFFALWHRLRVSRVLIFSMIKISNLFNIVFFNKSLEHKIPFNTKILTYAEINVNRSQRKWFYKQNLERCYRNAHIKNVIQYRANCFAWSVAARVTDHPQGHCFLHRRCFLLRRSLF